MKFSTVISLMAATSAVQAQKISSEKTVSNLNVLSSMSKDLDTKAKTVTLLNGFQTGPEVIQGYVGIVKTGTKQYHEMSGSGSKRNIELETNYAGSPATHASLETRQGMAFTPAQQQSVCNAYTSFVKVHQALLTTTIGKHGILEVTGVAYQMAAVLRGVEGVLDEISFTLIEEVPSCATAVKTAKKGLDGTSQKAIDTYAGGLP